MARQSANIVEVEDPKYKTIAEQICEIVEKLTELRADQETIREAIDSFSRIVEASRRAE